MTDKRNRKTLLQHLIHLSREISRGRFGNPDDLFELTKTGDYPSDITELAESFGMMIVKVEAREYQLQQTIDKLRSANTELTAARNRLARENTSLRQNILDKKFSKRIIGQNKQIREILSMIERLADSSINILLNGETGTGKELFAKAIHYHSNRCFGPFVAINCSAIPDELIESELFGIEKGVATGVEKRIGKLEQASGGTIFLDEVGDMPLQSQSKLLRVLQEHELERIGGRKTIPVDIRVVSATNRDLKSAVADKSFREDLYYRIRAVSINIPPLRERKDDIPLLARSFLDSCSKSQGRFPMRIDKKTLEHLTRYGWPGNVRELENEIERAVALSSGDSIALVDFSDDISLSAGPHAGTSVPSAGDLRSHEIQIIKEVLEETGGNKSEAARRLGISREGFRKKCIRYGLSQK